MGWLDKDTFRFFVPAQRIEIVKGKDGKKDDKRWIQGVASTSARDLQGEIVDQNGIDISYFVKHGHFNDDHQKGVENKVGIPTEARITKNGLWVKGYLLSKKKADAIWEHMQALEKDGSDRKMGFSIQGKVKRREGNKIASCWIQDVAITPAPVNTATWAEIAKSLSAEQWDLTQETEKSLEGDQSLSFEEAVSFLETNHGLPRGTAMDVAKAIFLTIPGE